ncbi:hypothetical protein [Bradyrhizobium monzae]|uniref:hypothetical protein n=1 Tax=Bradyrhizobium sp. Oc8 TaxID=2876780 RepID=UPI001F27B011|nr:hypothetical protein [Bradyrhizobium sp. Oc8]
MTNLGATATIKIDPSTQFCAYTYFSGLRAQGCDPIVRNGGLHWLVGESSVSNFHEWAALHDPDGNLRIEYARAMWSTRASDDEIIALGARQ